MRLHYFWCNLPILLNKELQVLVDFFALFLILALRIKSVSEIPGSFGDSGLRRAGSGL
jgi:hypothetical protein